MKAKLRFTGSIILIGISLAGIIFLFPQKNSETKYLENIQKALPGSELAGPDKSAFRDVLMTMDPETGSLHPKNVQEQFALKNQGRTQSVDFNWQQINSDIAGRVRTVMVDPNDGNKLWAGVVTGGLWYTPDFRNNAAWQPVSDNWESLSIGCMAFDPNDTQTFYVGTGESYTSVHIYRESSSSGAGIYKTTDGGNTWTLLSSTSGFDYVNDIVIRDEDGTSVIYAGVASGTYQGQTFSSDPSDGLYRSTDGGATWAQVLPNVASESFPYAVSDIEATSTGDLYVGTMRNLTLKGGGKILSSSDGLNWTVESNLYAENIIQEGSSVYGLVLLPGRVKLSAGNGVVYAVSTSGWTNDFNQIRDHGFFTRMQVKRNNQWSDLQGPDFWTSIPWHALSIQVDPNDDDRLAIGGLDVHALSDATSTGALSWIRTSDWTAMYHFADYTRNLFYGGIDQDLSDSIINHFVHADIHNILFVGGSSDEVLISNDGGLHYTNEFSKSYEIPTGERLDDYADFHHINNSLATTQYYTVALNPEEGNNEVLAGSQDNSTHTNEDGKITYAHMIGGGDGAYCFFDADDPTLRITSSQVGSYNIFIEGGGTHFYGLGGGTFINPGDYDDRSNLLYSNMAVDGGFEALSTSLQGRFLDTLSILNINKFLEKDDHGLDTLSYVKLGTNSNVSFSAIKVSPHDDELDVSVVVGNQLGDVYFVSGLPYNPTATKIDNDQLPTGYVSSVDIGDTNNDILVTFSNYGTASVWHTTNRGGVWNNIERNLPDIPVRDGLFNPHDDQKVLLATEAGIWGLESILDETTEWVSYNNGFPNVRVDMIDVRASDSTIVAATHGRGVFLGKFSQGSLIEEPLSSDNIASILSMYPNPTKGVINFNFNIESAKVYSISGRLLDEGKVENNKMDLSNLDPGFYLIQTESEGVLSRFKVLKN